MAADVTHADEGYQAWCTDHPGDGDPVVINGELVDDAWLGGWFANWIDARLEAVAHNMVKHPWSYAPLPTPPDWWNFR